MKLPKLSDGMKILLFWVAVFAALIILKIFFFPG
jgi:hypothetical protein